MDGESYGLSELGAGIAQFIVVLANAAVRQPSYILIDEPELNLHPSLQLDFLMTLGSYADRGVLFATHSLGLARSGSDRVYAVWQEILEQGAKTSRVEPYEAVPRLAEFVGELSFSGRPELGFDKILLVEGPTEVKTIQQFLRVYGKEHRVVVIPLLGGNLIRGGAENQLLEVKRITGNVFALIDSERTARDEPLSDMRNDFVIACAATEIPCHVLARRATENYFTQDAIRRAKGDKHRALAPYEPLNAAENGWAKRENWRIAREMTKQDLSGTDLGEFLESL